MHNKSNMPTWLKVVASLLGMLAIMFILGLGAFVWMDSWTLHGDTRTVPDVKGQSFNQASDGLLADGLTVELSDSVYDTHSRPGTVLEQNPKPGTKVKPGRVVYLTINAFSPRTVTVPQLTDISVRKAEAILKSLGITNVTVRKVMSEYADLVLAARCNGIQIQPGARLAVTSQIVLEVGDGMPEFRDSIMIDSMNTGTASDVEILDLF